MVTVSGANDELAEAAIKACPFSDPEEIRQLKFRDSPFFFTLMTGRHIGIHRPDQSTCNWTARILTREKRYRQKCLGPAMDLGRGFVPYELAIRRAFDWFNQSEISNISSEARMVGRTTSLSICPIGRVYTVGHALKDYTDWTRISRSEGGHYNNLVLINHHIVPHFSMVRLEDFSARHLASLAQQILDTPPKHGFQPYENRPVNKPLTVDEVRKRKRTFNSLVSILRMAFQHAWNNGEVTSERPWKSLKRIAVIHKPRTVFLSRPECNRLIEHCTPALKKLVLAGLYSGCRVGELGRLRVEDVGTQVFGIRVEANKRNPPRFVFLPDEGMAFFLECCEGKSPSDLVLRSDKGKQWKRQHTGLFKRAASMAGLPDGFVFHGLRHTYASDLVRSGVSLEVVAKQLGHANTITVSNTYGHLSEEFRENQIRQRFSKLSDEQAEKAAQLTDKLNDIWQACKPEDWRDYGTIEAESSTPSKSFTQTDRLVLETFRRSGP